MRQVEFIIDDYALAKRFAMSLPEKTQRARFSDVKNWKPERVVVVKVDNRLAAMADAVVTADDAAASISLVARPGFGAYALRGMHELRRQLDGRMLFSTLREPSPSTIAISRRFFDEVFDHGAWEISSSLMKTFGLEHYFLPPPIAVTDRFMQSVGLPPLRKIDEASKRQIIKVAQNPSTAVLQSPSGFSFDSQHLMALAFDVLTIPIKHRQAITRMNLLTIMAAKGMPVPSPVISKIADPKSFSFFARATHLHSIEDNPDGCFSIKEQNVSLESALRVLNGSPALPGLPSKKQS